MGAPLCQSIYFNTQFQEEQPGEGTLLESIYKGKGFAAVLGFADRIQFLVYLGILLYYLLCIRRKGSILHQTFAAAGWVECARKLAVHITSVPYLAGLGLGGGTAKEQLFQGAAVEGEKRPKITHSAKGRSGED